MGGKVVKAFIYLPEDENTIDDFKIKLKDLHTDEIIRNIKELPCSDKKKVRLVEELQKSII